MTTPDPLADLVRSTDEDLSPAGAVHDDPPLFASLLAEHHDERLGRLWYAEIRSACASKGRRYDPVVYARSATWDEAALDDLAMDAVERILSKGQIEYICDVAHDVGHVRALLHRQVRFTLLDRRDRTVIDNLLERAVEVLGGPGYVEDPEPPPGWRSDAFGAASDPIISVRDSREARLLALRLRRLPRMRAHGAERASPVWSTATLQEAVHDAVVTLGKVTRQDLDFLLRDALTSLAPGELVVEDVGSAHLDPDIGPEEAAMAHDVADRLVSDLTELEQGVLAWKLQGSSDADAARGLGVSRPTVDTYKKSGARKIRESLMDLNEPAQNAAITLLQGRLASLHIGRRE